MRLHVLLGLRRSDDDSPQALLYAIRNLTRTDAQAMLDRLHARAEKLWRPGADHHSIYFECLLEVFRRNMEQSRFSRSQIKAAETGLYFLCERAGEPFALGFENFNMMSRALSVNGARRLVARLDIARKAKAALPRYIGAPEYNAGFLGLDPRQETALRNIASQDPVPNELIDTLKPEVAWDRVAECFGHCSRMGRFCDYHAGEVLANSVMDQLVKDPEATALTCTAGLLPYFLPEWSSFHRRLVSFAPLRIGERLLLGGELQTRESVLDALKGLSQHQSIALLQDLAPHALSHTQESDSFYFGRALLHQLQEDGVQFSDALRSPWFERDNPKQARSFQKRALRALFRSAGVPALEGLDSSGVIAALSRVSPSVARIADKLFTGEAAEQIGEIFQTPYVRDLMATLSKIAYSVPTLQELALQKIDTASAFTELITRLDRPHLAELPDRAAANREMAIEVASRHTNDVTDALVRFLDLDALVRQKDIAKEGAHRRAWRELVEDLGLRDCAETFDDDRVREQVVRAALPFGDTPRTRKLVHDAGLDSVWRSIIGEPERKKHARTKEARRREMARQFF